MEFMKLKKLHAYLLEINIRSGYLSKNVKTIEPHMEGGINPLNTEPNEILKLKLSTRCVES